MITIRQQNKALMLVRQLPTMSLYNPIYQTNSKGTRKKHIPKKLTSAMQPPITSTTGSQTKLIRQPIQN